MAASRESLSAQSKKRTNYLLLAFGVILALLFLLAWCRMQPKQERQVVQRSAEDFTITHLDEHGNPVPGIKIGDGLGYLIDAPFLSAPYDEHIANLDIHVTTENKTFWNNKVRCYMDGENLVFTTD